MKKVISILLAITLCVAVLPITGIVASAEMPDQANVIQSIEIEDISIIENTKGYYDENGYYIYNDLYTPFWVTLTEGGRLFSYGGGIDIDGEWYSLEIDMTDQYENPWTAGNTYPVECSISGVTGMFNVTIEECPIQSIDIPDIDVIENTKGYYDENGNYIYDYFYVPFTLNLKDGRQLTSNGGGIDIDGEWYFLSVETENQYEEYWTAGNTYSAVGSILGMETPFNINIVTTPIESIEFEDISVMEYTHGYYDENKNYIYSDLYSPCTVTLRDGTQLDSDGHGITIYGDWYPIEMDISHQTEKPWYAGNTYPVECNILGVSGSFNVTVVECPVKSVEIDDISIIENTHGFDDENGNYIYNNFDPAFTVTLKDGRQLHSEGASIDIDGEWYSLSVDTEAQADNYWTVGNTYKASGSILGVTDTFNIAIVESPIAVLDIKDLSIIEKTHGYGDGNGNYIYMELYPTITVTLKDGRQLQSDTLGINIDGEWYSLSITAESQQKEYWTVGNTYQATGSILGMSDTFNVSIVKNPIESISAVSKMDLMQDIDCYFWEDESGTEFSYYDLDNILEYTIVHDGGKVFVGDRQEVWDWLGEWVVIYDYQSPEDEFTLGKNTVPISLLDVEGTATFNIVECAYKAVEISGANELTVTLTKNDNTKIKAEVIGYKNWGGGLGERSGWLETTAGTFLVCFNYKVEETEDYIVEYLNEDLQLTIGKLTSNVIDCNYIAALSYSQDLCHSANGYYGVAGENFYLTNSSYSSLEALISIACYDSGAFWDSCPSWTGGAAYGYIDAKAVEESVLEVFGITVDATKSANYNAKTGKVKVSIVTGNIDSLNDKISFKNGVWTYIQKIDETKNVMIKLNEDVTIHSIVMYDPNSSFIGDPDSYGETTELNGVLFNKDKTTLLRCPTTKSGEYVIPDGVTSIADFAFVGCDSLTSVTIPNSVTSIGEGAFDACPDLTLKCYENSYAQDYAEYHDIPYVLLSKESLVRENGTWYYTVNGKKVNTTTLVNFYGTWYYVKDGVVDFSATTLCRYYGTWYYVNGGIVDFSATTLVEYNGNWYYVQNGILTWGVETLVPYYGNWYYVKNSTVDFSATTLFRYYGTWYYVKGGMVDFSATTLCNYYGTWYYVKGGVADFSATTLVNYGGSWYYVKNGILNWGVETLVNYYGTWYYVKNSTVDFSATTLCNYYGTWYYVKGGVADFSATTLCNYYGTWYYVKGGVVDFSATTLVNYGGTWYYVKNGVLNWGVETLVKYYGTWYYVKNSSVNFSANLTYNFYGTNYKVVGGIVRF